MLRHPEKDLLKTFIDSLDSGAAGLVLHLLQCERCSADTEAALSPLEQRRGALALHRQGGEIDYSALWDRIEKRNREAVVAFRKEREDALPLFRELLSSPAEERSALVREGRRFGNWSLADLLLAEARTRPPQEREDLARLALEVAERLRGLPERSVEDLRAAALCQLAEALRLRGDRPGAEIAFQEVSAFLVDSSDVLERANYCHLLAGLRRDQGRLDEALALLSRAADLLEEIGNLQARTSVLVEVGFLFLENGEAARALAAFDDAVSSGRHLAAGLAFRAATGVAMALAMEGRSEEALGFLVQARSTYGWSPESPEGLRIASLQGRIALSAGKLDQARTLLTIAFHGHLQAGRGRDALKAAVSLARAHAQTGRARGPLRDVALHVQPLLATTRLSLPSRLGLEKLVRSATAGQPVGARWLKELEELLERDAT